MRMLWLMIDKERGADRLHHFSGNSVKQLQQPDSEEDGAEDAYAESKARQCSASP